MTPNTLKLTQIQVLEELKAPTYESGPHFVTGIMDAEGLYAFRCSSCRKKMALPFAKQIKNRWAGKSPNIPGDLLEDLKRFYMIGILNKSHEGGNPVFDRISCPICAQEYATYCGVGEFHHSSYFVQVQGILKIQKQTARAEN
jgi:hypothetical protein